MESVTVSSGSAKFDVEVHGDVPGHDAQGVSGTDVVLLHAGVADRRVWAGTVAALPPGYRAIAYDRRGFGTTTYTSEEFSHLDDLVAVLEAVCSGPAVLVGNSMGGALALDAALARPDLVSHLVLIGTGITGATAPSSLPPHVQRISDLIDAAEESGDGEAVNRLEARLWLDGPASVEGRVGGQVRELFLAMNAIALGADDPGPERPRPAALDRIGSLQAPVTIVVGDLDLPHVVDRSHELHELLPQSRLVRVEDAAHLPQLEHPQTIARVIVDAVESAPAHTPAG